MLLPMLMNYISYLVNSRHQIKKWQKQLDNIYNEKPKKKLGNTESLPFLSTGDYETDARNNPNNIYIQRQLGLHYESVSNWEGAKDVYLRQINNIQ